MEDSSDDNSEDESDVSDGSQKRVKRFHKKYADKMFLKKDLSIIYN